ncbi:N-formylglutamate amidohydrolase [Rhizobium puerariae]|uniref:N-formylglutamate amidohydrolase n=1 Tax=Rhizobium puerariae TaxID=1585791 RepID=A0ABV6AIE3_9HYPH
MPDADAAWFPEIINPAGSFPCMIVCDHASSRVPAHYADLGLDRADLEKHIGVDIGIADVVRQLALRLDAPAVLSPCSRLLVDCNRWIEDPRCILAESDGIAVPGNHGLGEAGKAERYEAYFWPYHEDIGRVFSALVERTGGPGFLSLHSCTRQLCGGEFRAMDAGTIWHESNALSAALIDGLNREPGLVIGDNQPYSGIGGTFTIDYHTWGKRIPACGLEIVNTHLETAEGRTLWTERLARALEHIFGRAGQADDPPAPEPVSR